MIDPIFIRELRSLAERAPSDRTRDVVLGLVQMLETDPAAGVQVAESFRRRAAPGSGLSPLVRRSAPTDQAGREDAAGRATTGGVVELRPRETVDPHPELRRPVDRQAFVMIDLPTPPGKEE